MSSFSLHHDSEARKRGRDAQPEARAFHQGPKKGKCDEAFAFSCLAGSLREIEDDINGHAGAQSWLSFA